MGELSRFDQTKSQGYHVHLVNVLHKSLPYAR